MNLRAAELIERLGLSPHPEGGHYAETYRAARVVDLDGNPRAAATAIYFLVTREQPRTYLHRLVSDELFHFYEGGPLDLLLLRPDGEVATARLGLDLSAGEIPQVVIPAGTWFATELAPAASHCLVGCTVAPGFEFDDFELARTDLAAAYPAAAERIARHLP